MSETLETPISDTMEIDLPQADETQAGSKRLRDEATDEPTKKPKAEVSVEEQRLQKLDNNIGKLDNDIEKVDNDIEKLDNDIGKLEEKESTEAILGPKSFGSGVEMFDYFVKFLRFWTPNININKYEHMVLLELLKKGHLMPDQKIGVGVRAFQVRYHPQYKSRCFFLIREDDTVDDFSFRKCVNHILPLPENMQLNHDDNKAFSSGGKGGGRGSGRGRGRGRGHGRGGKPRS
ncbi:hypothetical protein LIER_21976 [Lithospermum erythrorhizon]|uniref:Uncharacterized protein n=1 Tax=Lithospermum erythrorhizon TaxID=34254 RepID=A0AAV3QT98_LITER